MIFSIPIYVETKPDPVTGARVYHARPLFRPAGPALKDELLNRLTERLARKVVEGLSAAGKLGRHEDLAAWAFDPPDLSQRRLSVTLTLRRTRPECRFLFVAFARHGSRVAFTPAVPHVWFDFARGEDLKARAEEALSEHFRSLEKEHEDGDGAAVDPKSLSLQGTAFITDLELDYTPPRRPREEKKSGFLEIGGGERVGGAEELRRVGRCLDHDRDAAAALYRDAEAAELTRLLAAGDRRPVLVVGPRQCGKTAVIDEAVRRRVEERPPRRRDRGLTWLVAPARLISGMSYVGQWENRLLAIIRAVKKREHVLYFDDLVGLFRAGQSAGSSLNVAQVLLPYLQRREVRVLGEATPEMLSVLRELDRGFADQFHIFPIEEPDAATALRILIGVQRDLEIRHEVIFDPDVIPAVRDLAGRYVRDAAFPGKAARVLRQLAVKAERAAPPPDEQPRRGQFPKWPTLGRDEVFAEFQAQTGLQLKFLDARGRLPRPELIAELGGRVVGQPRAVEAVADVLALSKARLNDPGRPRAAFLMLGPTGVGKTELAKAVSTYLFGSEDRLLRFDMNEFVDPGSAARLSGTLSQPEGLMTAAVRRRPFAVILLDEVEKADPGVFDLLLQVLGEGRLTDALGRTADFTNAIILLTSNLGASQAGRGFGFAGDDKSLADAQYVAAAERFFRPEFLNRLDRVIPFRKLRREDVRRIATRLVQNVLSREGFRERKCLLRADGGAVERVVDAGFDPQLGARAMKRAVERLVVRPAAAELARLPVGPFTSVEVLPAGDGELAVFAHGLDSVEPVEVTPPASDPGVYRRALDEIEDEMARLRPSGPVGRADLRPEHARYFALREAADAAMTALRELETAGGPRFTGTVSLPAKLRGVRIRPRQAQVRLIDYYDKLKDIRDAEADEFRGMLEELALAAASRDPAESAWADLDRRLRLLRLAADDDAAASLLWLRVPPEPPPYSDALNLPGLYRAAFGGPLGGSAEPVELPDGVGLLLRGPGVAKLAALEAGTHMLCPRHRPFFPISVCALPLGVDEDYAAAVETQLAAYRAWRERLESGDNPLSLGPVVRVYSESGAVIDLRTGASSAAVPTADDLAGWLLATLPSPLPDADEPEDESDDVAGRAERLVDDDDWDR